CRERDHVLRCGAELDADDVLVHVRAKDGGVDRVLELAREVTVLARDHGCGRHLDGDLLCHVRAGEHCDGPPLHASRETLTGRGGRARTPFPTSRLRRRGTSRAPYEVDRHGYALQAEALAQLVLDPVAIVARDEPRIVDEDSEARWPRVDLRGVEQIQAPAVARRRLAAVA